MKRKPSQPRRPPKRIYVIDVGDYWEFGLTKREALDNWESGNWFDVKSNDPPKPSRPVVYVPLAPSKTRAPVRKARPATRAHGKRGAK